MRSSLWSGLGQLLPRALRLRRLGSLALLRVHNPFTLFSWFANMTPIVLRFSVYDVFALWTCLEAKHVYYQVKRPGR